MTIDPRIIIGHRKNGRPIYLAMGGSQPGGDAGAAGGSGSGGAAGSAGAAAGNAGETAGGGAGGTGGAGAGAAGAAGSGDAAAGQSQQTASPVTPGQGIPPNVLAQLQTLGWTPPAATPAGANAGGNLGDPSLPAYGHREALEKINELRTELGRDRTTGKVAAQGEVHAIYAHALGVEAKPEAIAARLNSLVDADTRANSASLQLAIYRRAATIGANADRLLDSSAFMAGVTGLDPAGSDALDAKIRDAANADPMYRTATYRGDGKNGQAPAGTAVVTNFQGSTAQPNGKPATIASALDKFYANI